MTYHQFKKQWLDRQHNPATGYDHDQESVIVQAYIGHLEGKVEELESELSDYKNLLVELEEVTARKEDRLKSEYLRGYLVGLETKK